MTTITVRLGEVADFINGVGFKQTDWSDEGLRIIRIQNLTDPSKPFNRTTRQVKDTVRVRPGDLLVSWSATLGVFEWTDPEDAVLNQHIFRVIPDYSKVDASYLKRVLEASIAEMERHVHGATMKHINRKEFLGTQIPLPPLEEQRRIAAVLDAADELRAKRRQALAKLDTLTQAIFINMFGDPLQNDFGWKTEPLEDVSVGIFDCPHSTPKWTDSGLICLRTPNLGNGTWDWTDTRFVSEQTFDERSRRAQLEPGDIVLSREGTVGIAAVVDEGMRLCMGQRLVQVRPDDESVSPRFLLDVLLFLLQPDRIAHVMAGSTAKHLNVKELRQLKIILPTPGDQDRYAARVSSLSERRGQMVRSLCRFDDLFASLQQRAFRGEL